MANKWNIPVWLEQEVIGRDKRCVYCRVPFADGKNERKDQPSWEHIVNDSRIITRDNIARCCIACNASKGTKSLDVWLESNYCKSRGITKHTIAEVARKALGRKAKK